MLIVLKELERDAGKRVTTFEAKALCRHINIVRLHYVYLGRLASLS